MGELKVGILNLNKTAVVSKLLSVVQQLIGNRTLYFNLKFKPKYYFQILNGNVPSESGWYIILDEVKPIYVGQASDLNDRLNTNHGSLDNFGKRSRSSDDKRNFIKRLDELSMFRHLRVCIVFEGALCRLLDIDSSKLTKLDRDNIEKVIDIHRGYFNYLR